MKYFNNISFKKLTSPWILSFLLFQLSDWIIYLFRVPNTNFNPLIYFLSLLMSLLMFYSLGLIYNSFSTPYKKAIAVIYSLFFSINTIANFYVYREFGESFSYSMLRFSCENPSYFLSFVKSYLFDYKSLIILPIFALYLWIWTAKAKENKQGKIWKNIAIIVGLIIFQFMLVNQIKSSIPGQKITPDFSLFFAVKQYGADLVIENKSNVLHPSTRYKVFNPNPALQNKYNILLVLNESWGTKSGTLFDNENKQIMPNLMEWIKNESDHFTVFQAAYSNSTATDVSVPSILTGVAPWESASKLHKMPFIWDYAKACNYTTMLISSQYFNWSHLDNFFFSPGPDIRVTGERTGLPTSNDYGVDDFAMCGILDQNLKKIDKNKPFFAVYQTNALHSPFQQKSSYLKNNPSFNSKYDNSLYILDATFNELKKVLENNNMLDNTIIIFTSDHGESDKMIHKPGRLTSYYDEIINIPILLRMPKQWIEENPTQYQYVLENSKKNINNIDIVPTITDLLKYDTKGNVVSKLLGKSLLSKIDSNRVLYTLNTNEIRKWSEEGFAIIDNQYRFIYTMMEGIQFYDISTDRKELNNTWTKLNDKQKSAYLGLINANKELKRVFEKNKR